VETSQDVLTTLAADGFAIVPRLLDPAAVRTARQELTEILEFTPWGRDDFEGRSTRRVYALFAKTRRLDAAATDPLVLGVLDEVLGHYQLSAPTAIEVGPGQVAQPLHFDGGIYPVPRRYGEVVVTVMLALDDFTEANGATRVVRGSHRWDEERPADDASTVAAEMPAGSALFYLGRTWHGAGANRTDRPRLGVVLHYAASWLRPIENHALAVPPPLVATLAPRLQELLGYDIHPPFIGYVDGRHPRRVLESGAQAAAPLSMSQPI
jgi:ectoine hydroxylase-related dioxygenase (phytanoyl-CoA dioxygenase family)